ncbi:SpoIIE family protein phosphatase [Streptomyces sp. TRM64462]|uniref:SpoIIE family protein phosphatase n=1 Tax=Streptomyces sp. TRM64462 TaxID=2741726 RepID=UPI0020C7EB4A|nr:SpoIIE family protein phosphatase [Streptomyces sp. TRM64462]
MEDTGASVGMVYLLPPDGRALRLAVLSGVPLDIAAPWTRVALDDPIPVAHAVAEQRLVWVGDQEEMARHYPRPGLVLPYRFSLAAVPLSTDAARWGGLVMLWPGDHPPVLSDEETDAVRSGSARMAAVLERAAHAGNPVRPERPPLVVHPHRPVPPPHQAAAAVAFADRLPGGSCALDLDGRITFVTPAAAGLLGVPVARLLGALPWEALPWMDDPVVEDRYRAAVISRETVAFTAVRPPGHRLRFRLHPDATGISVRITPAPASPSDDLAAGGPESSLAATTEAGTTAAGTTEAAGAQAATAEAATAEETAPGRAISSAGAIGRAGALYHLVHLAATLTEAVGVQDVAEQTAEQMTPALGAQSLALLMAEDGRLLLVGQSGCGPELAERLYSVPLTSDVPVVRVLASGAPLFFGDSEELRSTCPGAVPPSARGAWAFLPLIASGRPVGSLVLGYARPRVVSSGERAILISLAGLVAQAMDRARLYDAKHELAHRLQAGLLPHSLPRVPGLDIAARYLPAAVAMGIGGDFYDVIRLGATTAAVTIGDVQGHNVEAAALMGQVRTAVHASAGAPPGEVLARTNRLLMDLDPGLFTSCLYAHLDLAGHRAVIATAGHPPPLCRHPDGTTETLDVPPGLLLGIDSTATYPATELPLAPGTVLALYTDGLVEAPGVDIRDATDELAARLSHLADGAALTMDDVADALVRDARGTVPRNDDIALVLLRIQEDTGA